jgi:hypothetical protein
VKFGLALLGAVTMALAAVVLLVAAVDVQRLHRGVTEDDVRFATNPLDEQLWRVNTILPGDPAARLLGMTDDLRYRRVLRTVFLARPRLDAFALPRLELARGEAQVQLSDLMTSEQDKRRLSQEKNLLGALALAIGPRQEREQQLASFRSAVVDFTDAIRLDPENEDAMHNLEVTLQLLRELPKTFETLEGRKPLEDPALAGLQDTGSGY